MFQDVSEEKKVEYAKIWQGPESRKIEQEFEENELKHQKDLDGVIDMHVHIGPEIVPRRTDAVEVARQCCDEGFRAIVIKPFEFCSVERAYFAEKLVPDIRVFGGLTFGRATGGLNVGATEVALRWGAKGVWLPIHYTEHMAKEETRRRCPKYFSPQQRTSSVLEGRDVYPVTKGDEVVPELLEIMALVAKSGAFLGTSHISPEETILVLEAAKEIGCKVAITHINSPIFDVTEAQLEEMAALGGYLVFNSVYAIAWWGQQTTTFISNMIKAAGPENSIMCTDVGQVMSPSLPEAMRIFIRAMRLDGISQADIDKMTKENPARLLGI